MHTVVSHEVLHGRHIDDIALITTKYLCSGRNLV